MNDWESEIWENFPPDSDEPALLEMQLPGSVIDNGTKRHCSDFPSIKIVAKFYAEVSQKPVDESPRVFRRLISLRGLSHEEVEQVLARGP